ASMSEAGRTAGSGKKCVIHTLKSIQTNVRLGVAVQKFLPQGFHEARNRALGVRVSFFQKAGKKGYNKG
ncbi:MAG: hypothetical protein II739_05695, partial [Clostridia bacterium]|nr:hypothetical protein [Clostridia bacterium]